MWPGKINYLKMLLDLWNKAMHNTTATTAIVGFAIEEREGKMGNAEST